MCFGNRRNVERVQLGQVRLDRVERSGLIAARCCVYEDRRVVSIEDRVREIEPANAEINDAHIVGPTLRRHLPYALTTERVVAEKNVAAAGYQYFHNGSTSATEKKNR